MTIDDDGLLNEIGLLPNVDDLDATALQDQRGILSVEDAAVRAGVSVPTVRMWIRRRQVFAFEWDGLTWIGEKSLYDCEHQRRQTPQGRPRKVGDGVA